jgi:hypothetical protein
MFGGGRSFIHSRLITGLVDAVGVLERSESVARRNVSLEIKITGNLELLLDCNKSDVTNSSSVSAIYAHPL